MAPTEVTDGCDEDDDKGGGDTTPIDDGATATATA